MSLSGRASDPLGSLGDRRLSDSKLLSLIHREQSGSGREKRWASQPAAANDDSSIDTNDTSPKADYVIHIDDAQSENGETQPEKRVFSSMIPENWSPHNRSRILSARPSTDATSLGPHGEKHHQSATSTAIDLRHFVHEASHILHNYSEDLRTWCERRFGPKPLFKNRSTGPLDIESGRLPMERGKDGKPIPHVDGPPSSEPYTTNTAESSEATTESGYSRTYRLFPDEPAFGQWFKVSKWDILILSLCSLLSLVLYKYVPPLGHRVFPVFYRDTNVVVHPEYAYPRKKEYINTLYSALISFLVPLVFILVIGYFFVGSFWDMDNAVGAAAAIRINILKELN
jgi:hypothetical protein